MKQLIDFEINAEIDNFDADISHQMPPFYYFSEIILHNLSTFLDLIPFWLQAWPAKYLLLHCLEQW